MAKYNISNLRNIMFEAMERLLDQEENFPVDKAKAIADLGQVMINSVKAEIDYLKINEGQGTGFIPVDGETVSAKMLN